jgi:hypothetical protein
MLRPPSYREVLGDAGTRRAFRIKQLACAFTFPIDFVIWLTLRGRPSINQHALKLFLTINLSLVAVDLLIGEVALRFARTHATWRAVLMGSPRSQPRTW